jgi:hypothetical protein
MLLALIHPTSAATFPRFTNFRNRPPVRVVPPAKRAMEFLSGAPSSAPYYVATEPNLRDQHLPATKDCTEALRRGSCDSTRRPRTDAELLSMSRPPGIERDGSRSEKMMALKFNRRCSLEGVLLPIRVIFLSLKNTSIVSFDFQIPNAMTLRMELSETHAALGNF